MPAPEISRQDAKIDLWERKLLDLTTRNALLNVKIKGNTIPLFVTSASDIEDAVSAEKDYTVISRSVEDNIPVKDYGIEDLEQTENFDAVIAKAASEGSLYSSLTDKELEDKLKALYRNSRSAIEEDGAAQYLEAQFFSISRIKVSIPVVATSFMWLIRPSRMGTSLGSMI